MSKVKVNAPSESSGTGDIEQDAKLCKAFIDFRNGLLGYFDTIDTASVELGFESSYDEKTHHAFNVDEVVFLSDVEVSPSGSVVFKVPFGTKEKTFSFSEAELINIEKEGTTEQLNTVVNRIFRESFSDFSDINSVTMLERKYIAPNQGLIGILNEAENYLSELELNKDRSKLYTALPNYGIF